MDTVNRFVFPALREHAARPLQVLRDRTWTYNDAARAVHGIAQHLRERGLRPGDRVALLGENAPEWLHAFLGVLAAGGVAVPRGEDTPPEELRWVLEHSGAALAFVGSPKIAPLIPAGIEQIPLTGLPEPADVSGDELAAYASAAQPEDLAVLLYTSGTTGRPKGVMLEQRNIAHNLRTVPALVPIEAGDVWVSILPPWHTFELTVELCALSIGCMTAYSNKRRIKQDLAEHRPHFFAGVPRLWEAFQTGARDAIRKRGPFLSGLFEKCFASSRLWRKRNPLGLPLHALGKLLFYRKVARAIGGRLKYGICGGGYLPPHVDEFFAIMGVEILVGYGLTETAPVVAMRRPEKNVHGTIGRALPDTEIRVGPQGTFQVRGPQVMRGYYRDEELTGQALDQDGWFDTGDLGRITEDGDLVFTGRLKETIVLSGGENVEPEPIESSALTHPAIEQVMIVGQDRKTLAALVVPSEECAAGPDPEETVRNALLATTGSAAGFRAFERVARVHLLDEPFSVENGLLTPTLKMRRSVIADRYASEIDALCK